MKILIFSRGLMHGGAERQLCLIANGLAARGHAVTVMVYYGGLPLECDLDLGPGGVRLQIVEKRGRWDVFGFLGRLVRAVRSGGYDVIYSFLPLPNVLMALLRPLVGRVPLVWGLRSSSMSLTHYDWLVAMAARLEHFFRGSPDLMIANSEAGRRDFEGLGYPGTRLRVVENGVDTESFYYDEEGRQALRRLWNIPDEHVLIGVVARLDPMKGFDVFVDAVAMLAELKPHYRFVWVGADADETPDIRPARAGVSDVLRLEPVRDNMRAVYSAFDVACLPSVFGEGFPNAIAEAMACERIVVAADVGDSARLVANTGILVAAGDAGALASALEKAVDAAGAGDRRFPAARQDIADRFAVAVAVARTEGLLEETVRNDDRAGVCDI